VLRNKKRPSVSVIVATYNRKELLGKTICSILSQTFDEFELIVVDDGSTDGTKCIFDMIDDPRIQYIYTNNWGGPARPRNIGIKAARGQYIAFCDDDDIWYPDKLRCQLAALKDRPFGLCFTNFDYIDSGGNKLEKTHKIKKRRQNPTFHSFILGGGDICNSSVMIKRSVVDTVGLLEEDPELIAAEDYHYWARVLRKYKACYVDRVLVSYRFNSKQCIRPTFSSGKLRKQIYLLKSIDSLVNIQWPFYYLKFLKILLIYLISDGNWKRIAYRWH